MQLWNIWKYKNAQDTHNTEKYVKRSEYSSRYNNCIPKFHKIYM